MHEHEPLTVTPADKPLEKNTWLSWVVGFVLLSLFIIIKYPFLRLPYHWDEAGAYVKPAMQFAQGTWKDVFLGFRPGSEFFGHPPLLYISLALVYKIFGFSVVVSHLYIWFWAFIGLVYTFLLGRFLFDTIGGFLGGIFLLFTPLYIAQSGMVLGDMPIAALGVMAVYYAVRACLWPSILCSTVAVLTKETAVAIPLAIALYAVLCQIDRYGSRWKLVLFGLPPIALACFYVWQKTVTGHWVSNPYFENKPMGSLEPAMVMTKGIWIASFTCLQQYRILWALLILLCVLKKGRSVWKREYLLFCLIAIFIIGAFSIIYFGQRYILPILPYLAVVSGGAVVSLLPKRLMQLTLGAFVIIMSASVWYGHGCGYGNFDYDMQYTDMVIINQQCCHYLEETYSQARVVAPWPMGAYLKEPWYGYVKQPVNTATVSQPYDFIILTGFSKQQPPDDVVLEKRFEQNHKMLSLYRRKSNESF